MRIPDTKKVSLIMLCALLSLGVIAQTVNNLNANITIAGGTNVVITGGVTNAGAITNSGTVALTGNWANNGTGSVGTGTVEFNGTAAQNVSGTSVTTFGTLKVNKASGDVNLLQNAAVNTTLNFTAGKISTAANKVSLA